MSRTPPGSIAPKRTSGGVSSLSAAVRDRTPSAPPVRGTNGKTNPRASRSTAAAPSVEPCAISLSDNHGFGDDVETGVRRKEGGPRNGVAYKLLAVDLDGTLLDKTGVPHDIDVAAMRALQDSGIAVTIVTGRLFSGTTPAARAIGITGAIACADGSHVALAGCGTTLVHHGMDAESLAVVRQACMRSRVTTFVFLRDAILHDDDAESFLPFVSLWTNNIRHTPSALHTELPEAPTAVVALGPEAAIRLAMDDIQRKSGGKLQCAAFGIKRLGDCWGLIIRREVASKGTALAWLAAHHGCTLAETVCVGDWLNDVSMMKVAGRSFAMGQAPEEVKAIATDVLEETSSIGGGIARVVRELFGVHR